MVKLIICSWSYFMSVYNEKRFAVIWFDHAIRFDVIVTLVFFNNLRLKRVCLFKFENNQF